MLLDWNEIERLVDNALNEDIGRGDLTTAVAVPPETRGTFTIRARQPVVVAGMDIAAFTFRKLVPDAAIEVYAKDGAPAEKDAAIAKVSGAAPGLLTAERTALNLLQFLSAISTCARSFVREIEHTKAVMVDTRKTIPGYRNLSKYAAQLGGLRNHRIRLDDGVLIKDNHISMAGGVGPALEGARRGVPLLTKIEVECDTLDQAREAIAAGADMLLLDNMSLDQLREAVAISAGRVPLEASGGVTIDTVRAIAETGVDFISSGRITQSPPPVDIGLDVVLES
jgi:nicotinate-nucleotide pyrophosphorylase (carboxylating)